MSFRERVRGLLLVLAIVASISMAFGVAASCVGGRAPSPSPGVPTATARADSEAAPARSPLAENGTEADWARDALPCGVATPASSPTSSSCPPQGEDGGAALRYPPASTVTQSALTGEGGAPMGSPPPERLIPPPDVPRRPTVTVSPADGGAYIAPATPVATSRAVETLVPKSINSYDPWPAYLWPVVECLIQRESGGNAGAVGKAGERGLMQVGPANFTYLADRGIPPDSLFDPATNIRAGWIIYLYWQNATGDGFWPWKSTRGGCA